MEQSVRPEAIIADIYSQINEQRSIGQAPKEVLMNLKDYRLLDWYRNFLGDAENSAHEYLGQYEIFGLEILIEAVERPVVR
jgi:hypothetical protein